MKPVVFHPAAEEEAEKAAAHYEHQRAGLGQQFRGELDAAAARIRENPQAYGVEIGIFRACPGARASAPRLLDRPEAVSL